MFCDTDDHEAVAASPECGVDLTELLGGSAVVVDLSDPPSVEDEAVTARFTTFTRNLIEHEMAAGVTHHVALSSVGTERLLESGYFRARCAQERLIKASPIPYSATSVASTLASPRDSGEQDLASRGRPRFSTLAHAMTHELTTLGPHLVAALALVGAVAAGTAYAQSGPEKAPPPDVGSGRVAWFDITTSDLAGAKTFYGGLFGWTFTPLQGAGDQAVEIVSRDLPIGTIRVAGGPITATNGVVYVQVSDLPASCTKAVALGAKMVPGFPFNLSDRPGAIALVIDPSGHPIGMYSRTRLPAEK